MSSSDDDYHNSASAATDEAVAIIVAPNPASDTTETPANVAPDLARPPSNIAELNPVPNADTHSPTTTKSMLVGFWYTFSSGEEHRPVDEQCENLTIGALRQVATHNLCTHALNCTRVTTKPLLGTTSRCFHPLRGPQKPKKPSRER